MITTFSQAKDFNMLQPMEGWDLVTERAAKMSSGVNWISFFEKAYDVYGIVTQDKEYLEYRKQKALARIQPPESEEVIQRRAELQAERERIEIEQDESTGTIVDKSH